jgi:hypothetical protein
VRPLVAVLTLRGVRVWERCGVTLDAILGRFRAFVRSFVRPGPCPVFVQGIVAGVASVADRRSAASHAALCF